MEGFKQVVMDDWAPFITSYVNETLFQLTKYDIIRELGLIWNVIRSSIIVPVLTASVYLCSVMILMVFVERLYMSGIIYYVMLSGFKPEKRYKFEAINPVEASVEEQGEVQKCASDYPMVLVQIPMYNERKVYKLSIEAVCRLSWPSDRIIVQVLDDSTDPLIKDLVQIECRRWEKEGINIKYETRIHRNGYKAGALKEGLKHSYVEGCEFVAIFDADFQPEPDYLHRTVPYFIHNPEIGLVQAQWESTNSRECIMTRIQEVSLNFHFKVEQEVGSFAYAFFSFNGTAGVWRLTAIDKAGGWNARTTTEDLDLSLRASLHGWKFVYVSDIKVKSELPSTYKALRYQQHRWSCGPANLFRKMVTDIIRNKRISLWRKIYVIYNFFLVRKMITHIVTFTFFCVIIPMCVMFPEVTIPKWGAVYIPTAITLLNIIETPRSIHLLAFWISLETVMSMTRIKAILIGLLDRKRASEWVVTEKIGDTLLNSNDSNSLPIKLSRKPPLLERIYLMELCMGGFIFFCACYDLAIAKSGKYIYLYVQSSAFFICGLGYVYKLSIGAACRLSWPSDRIIVQVLDDSTDPLIKDLVQIECQKWENEGINIKYETRANRNGYKAGGLKEGLKHSYVKECEFVAIFDADFQPDPDYLHRTVPYLIHNPEIGLVQAQWEYTNSHECIMTRIQELSLNFHFKVEQEVGSYAYAFFSFNGTAGVWRLAAINEAGGWNARTTTEDLDLSLRASLQGWKFVYISDIKVKCELPSTYKALRYQQHRWSCGPANLFRKMVMDIIRNKRISFWRKIYVIYNFFLVRKMVTHIISFTYFCVIIPMCVMFPEVDIPKWSAVYIPTTIMLLNIIETPRSIHLLVFWILLENVLSMTRIKAIYIGLLDRKRANEWVVTEKLGEALLISEDSNSLPIKASRKLPLLERIYLMELCMGTFLFFCAFYDLAITKSGKYIYLYLQGSAFLICGLGYVGTQPPYD
ncbi:hypothetical protein C5167_000926 [Papaver somniferum]|uniref:glucomannan 4-beta-mannosyltransferase n=1 Tax=Papaver somniferum TaxID=3469 RepID=A0A4Y7KWN1_PAPSO|nr:hypothetical protein C5167_000926 [Papaver somniferum]